MKVQINVGVSGAGKSTFTENYLKDNPNTLRINRDDIRKGLVLNMDGYYKRKDLHSLEGIVTSIERETFYACVQRKKDVILDNTNLSKKTIEEWLERIEVVNQFDGYTAVEVCFKIFDLPSVNFAKVNVLCRDFGQQRVAKSFDGETTTFYGDVIAGTSSIPFQKVDDIECVDYIDKQWNQFQEIKKWLEKDFKNYIV